MSLGKIGLSLSGGGSRGFAHLGAIKAMYEFGLKPSHISGSSAGALVGALIAQGYSPDYLFEILHDFKIRQSLRPSFHRFGLFSTRLIEDYLQIFIPHNSFEGLEVKLSVCCTAIKESKPHYFDSGDLKKIIAASCSIPGIFKPVEIDNVIYVDGGVSDNLPINPIKKDCDFKVGVNVMPKNKTTNIRSLKDILLKSLYLSISHQTSKKRDQFDIYLEPKHIIHFNGLKLRGSEKMYKLGYESMLSALETRFN